ncbi:MAG: sugar ABC transporter permease [Candidatus Sericytochromatia bacterium]|nr:sugar ABC transporter permease [Candidatus Sericytochromatia bacterium]
MSPVPALRHPLRSERIWGLLLASPALLIIGIFSMLPTLASFLIGFTDWDLLGAPRWVGLDNYSSLLADPVFPKVVANTLLFVVLYLVLDLVVALALALALNQKLRGLGFFRTAYFLPVVTSMVAVSIVWEWIFDPRGGALNEVLRWFGAEPIHWLSDPGTALPALVVMSVWKSLGTNVVLFLAGLQALPGEVLESAEVDGATGWKRFWHITLPLLGPTVLLVGILACIRAFQTFDSVYIMTHGGPRRSTTVIVYWLFQNAFTYFKLGKASALAYMLFGVLAGLTWVQWTLRKRWVHQEQDA